MSVSKTALTISSVAVAALFGGGVYFVMNLNSIAENAIERVATETLGVPVGIGSLDIALKEKRATVKGLRIGNPEGFKKSHAMTVDTIGITLESISKELVRFKDIRVEGTNVNLEVQESGTNLQTIQNNVASRAKPAASEEGAQKIKVIIDQLAMTGAQLNPSVTLIEAQDLSTVTVPDIHLSGIGQKENGILVREAMAQVWTELSRKFSHAANNAGFYQGLSGDVLKDLGATQLESIKTQIKDGLDGVGNSLKNLFGN